VSLSCRSRQIFGSAINRGSGIRAWTSAITTSHGASSMKAVVPVTARLELSAGVKLVAVTVEVDLGHLAS
jgi:hypothetical protein